MRAASWGIFSELADQRMARGKRYEHEPLLCALLLAVLSGATSLRKMELFIEERLCRLNALFGTTWKKALTWVGIRRFLLKLDAGKVEEVVRRHAERQVSEQPGRRFITLDGKALRGSASPVSDIRARQLVSAFTQDDLIILGHIEVDDKSNEIPAVQSLIESLGLSGRVFTLDAMHCQKNACHSTFNWGRRAGAGKGKPAGTAQHVSDAAAISGIFSAPC
jgi:hypothetical protein